MTSRLVESVERWAVSVGIAADRLPVPETLIAGFPRDDRGPCRAPADPRRIAAWERRHGFNLPRGLRAWLELSDGFYQGVPLIHPLQAIGPMIPFARAELDRPARELVRIGQPRRRNDLRRSRL